MGSLLHPASSSWRRPGGAANCPVMYSRCERTEGFAVIQEDWYVVTPATSRRRGKRHAATYGSSPAVVAAIPSGSLVLPPCPPPRSIVHGAGAAPRPCAGSCASISSRPADLIQPHLRGPRHPGRARDRLDAGRLPPVGGRVARPRGGPDPRPRHLRPCCSSACRRPRTRSGRRTSPRTASSSGRSGGSARGIPICCS